MKLVYLISFLLLTFISCGKKEEPNEDLDMGIFFDITYSTTGTRISGINDWTAIFGSQEVRFGVPSLQNENIDCTATESSGCFRVSYTNYKEPQLTTTGICSGGYEGVFSYSREIITEEDEDTAEQPYNPLNPYQPDGGSSGGETVTPEDEENIVYAYSFILNVTRRSLSAGCSQLNPLDSFTMRIIRYPNGDLIVTHYQRSMEYYMVPKLN